MVSENITPEEKLLKIIEDPDVEKRKTPIGIKVKAAGLKAAGDWLKNFTFSKNTLKQINLQMVNKVAAVLCGCVTVFWIFDFAKTSLDLNKRFERIAKGMAVSSLEEKKMPKFDTTLDELLGQAHKRNIFTLVPPKPEPTAAAAASQVVSNFKLVGVLWSSSPQAMIENSKEQKTYFVSAGDRIGDIEVRKIFREKVVIGKDDQEWELR